VALLEKSCGEAATSEARQQEAGNDSLCESKPAYQAQLTATKKECGYLKH